jgi:hypothetical protein
MAIPPLSGYRKPAIGAKIASAGRLPIRPRVVTSGEIEECRPRPLN